MLLSRVGFGHQNPNLMMLYAARLGHVITTLSAESQKRVVDLSVAHFVSFRALSLKASMAPAHDSDSSNSEAPPSKSKSKAESPERHGHSDQPGPEESEEDEVYEIEKILDAKRGATGSVCFLNVP
jgi:hypothetical protein